MKDHLHTPDHGKRRGFSILIIVLLLLTTMILSACENPPSINGNASNNGGGNNNHNNTNSCNGTSNCNNTTINVINQTSDDWNVTVNSAYTTVSYNGYSTDSTDQFLIVNATFKNISSGTLILSGALFQLQDGNGQQYTESQASGPGNSFTVNPNLTITTETSFEVPDSQCNYTLSFIGSTNSNAQWSIGTCQGKGNIQSPSLTA